MDKDNPLAGELIEEAIQARMQKHKEENLTDYDIAKQHITSVVDDMFDVNGKVLVMMQTLLEARKVMTRLKKENDTLKIRLTEALVEGNGLKAQLEGYNNVGEQAVAFVKGMKDDK
jgi:hypothetical protein